MEYLDVEEYKKIHHWTSRFATGVMIKFAPRVKDTRDHIIMGSIARGSVCLDSIFVLYERENYHDCWVLHRALVERLFHIHALDAEDQFEVFEQWSFVQAYERRNKMRSDQTVGDRLPPGGLPLTEDDKARYESLKSQGVDWKRPRAEDVARTMDLHILYAYAYDIGSMYVHPMATDGWLDLSKVPGLTRDPPLPKVDNRVVLNNSIIAYLIQINECLRASTVLWRGIVGSVLDEIREMLVGGAVDEPESMKKLFQMGPSFDWCDKG